MGLCESMFEDSADGRNADSEPVTLETMMNFLVNEGKVNSDGTNIWNVVVSSAGSTGLSIIDDTVGWGSLLSDTSSVIQEVGTTTPDAMRDIVCLQTSNEHAPLIVLHIQSFMDVGHTNTNGPPVSSARPIADVK